MKNYRIRSASEQLAGYFREQIQSQSWIGTVPGENRLMARFEVGRDTVRAALALLEEEGLLVSDGQGRRRRIVENGISKVRSLRIRILLYERNDSRDADISLLMTRLQAEGFDAEFASKSLHDLGMDAGRVARFVASNPADAWITCSCAHPVNKWFSAQPFPSLAMFGRFEGLQMATAYPALRQSLMVAVRRLIELGHRRIVMFAREERRKPKLALPEQSFINELEAAGIKTGDYNLPDWEESCDGLTHRLDELFRNSPPTALIFQETPIFIAARAYLAHRGIHAPRHVSLLTSDPDPSFEWSKPAVTHLRWDSRPVVHRMVRWARNVAQGKEDLRQVVTKAEFVEGETIGPVPGRR